jgi:hypothetical protein
VAKELHFPVPDLLAMSFDELIEWYEQLILMAKSDA